MSSIIQCPICLNLDGGSCYQFLIQDIENLDGFRCDICGTYTTSRELWNEVYEGIYGDDWKLNQLQRAVLSYRIRTKSNDLLQMKSGPFVVTPEVLDLLRSNARLPGMSVQAANLIRFVGDEVSRSGESIRELPNAFHVIIGSFNREAAFRLLKELEERKIVMADPYPHNINLTLDGWNQYETEKRGQFGGNYGFIAMQFDDTELDAFVRDVVKPTVKEDIGYELVDMRDVSQAGVIDNIMRVQIRDAAFVIADLTHDNFGAYWEAGYAEGLGKPVIYICEQKKFDEKSTHFDTNHCTTIPWSRDNDEDFRQELIATIRRSLNLFPQAD